MLAIKLDFDYVSGDSMSVQGSWRDVRDAYGDNWNISKLGGGHGNWLLTIKSDLLINGYHIGK